MQRIFNLSQKFMQQEQKKAKVSEFLSVCVQLAFQSSRIINNIQLSDGKKTQMKGEDDPMTQADIKAQTLIIKGLRQYWPNIKIVGEEDIEFKGDLGFNVNDLNSQMISGDLFMEGKQGAKINNEFEIEKAIVWVDPLDGTLSYVNNELDSVTTLIGLSYDSVPMMGIIGQPYQLTSEKKYEYNPKVLFGHSLQNTVYQIEAKKHNLFDDVYKNKNIKPEPLVLPERPKNQDGSRKIIASTSKNHISSEKLQLVKNLNPDEILQYGGAGKKCIDVINGTVDYTVYIGRGTKKWDTAAGEALINCLDGVLTTTAGEQYIYREEAEHHPNNHGMIACMDKDLHKQVIKKTKDIKN